MADAFELVIGALIAGVIGLLTTEYRLLKERRALRSWLATGLLIDVRRTQRVLENIPLDTPEHAIEAVFSLTGSKIPLQSGMLYPKNGLYRTHYAEIMKLGPEVAEHLVMLYDDLYALEWTGEYYRQYSGITSAHYKDKSPDIIYNGLVNIKEHINIIIPILEAIKRNKRVKFVDSSDM